jgi:hypothetical protein
MSGKSNDGWYHGEFENLARRFTAPVTDCSDWESDIPADQWTVGEFVNLAQQFTAPVTDCSDWDREPAAWLELRVSVAAVADPAAVTDATAKLIRAADAAAPELGLTFDPARSHVDGGEVVVALTPTHPVGPADRLAEIVRMLAAAPHTTAAWRRAG